MKPIYAIDWYQLFDRSVCIHRKYVASREIAEDYLSFLGLSVDVNGFWYDNAFPYEARIVECIPYFETDLDSLKTNLDAYNYVARQRRFDTYDL